MAIDRRSELKAIRTFPALVTYLRHELDWPIENADFEELTFDYTPEELGIDRASAAKIQEIKRLRPLAPSQPWGIFFVRFEPKQLPVVALRRILSRVALKKRASVNSAERAAWAADDLLFISNFGEGNERRISFAHFSQDDSRVDLPILKVLGWDNQDTQLHLDHIVDTLHEHLAWPEDESDVVAWRTTWRAAFALRHREVVNTSKTLAVRLAELARAIRDRITTVLEIETDGGPVTRLMRAFQDALVHDLDADGFADMYAQTIAYGLLSARIADPEANTADHFAQHMRTSPFLKELLGTFLHVGGRQGDSAGATRIDFDELGVNEVVELLDDANMEAVVRDFGNKNPQEDPVIHFYELFLKEYDAKKRMQKGVFYTPRPVVSYIVRSVHEVLRQDFGLVDGLADTATWGEVVARKQGVELPHGIDPTDPFVSILDPATGTGTFLVEIIDVVYETLSNKWRATGSDHAEVLDLWNDYVAAHLLPRLHGYELLMAPYAIAHLKIGLKLHETGYRFEHEERARIYLTNALEPAQDFSDRFAFAIPALAHEAAAVTAVKEDQRFTVVIGNPPYAGISSNMTKDAQRMVDAYKMVDGHALNERKLWLQDDYVKFIRFAQTTLERTRTGVIGYITNHGYLDNPTFRGMRQSLIGTFEHLWLLDLHGNANKKEQSPDGSEDSNVFDIRQGAAILLGSASKANAAICHAELWGTRESKYRWLGAHSLAAGESMALQPDSPYYFLEPQNTGNRDEYRTAWKITEIMPAYCAGFVTARDHFVVAFEEGTLLGRIADLADENLSDADIRERYFAGRGSSKYPDGDTRGWKLPEVRARIQEDSKWRDRIVRCLYRPFDPRPIYWAEWMVDWPRPEMMRHMSEDHALAIATTRSVEVGEFDHVFCSRLRVGHHTVSLKEVNYMFPLWLEPDDAARQGMLALNTDRQPNFAPPFLRVLADSIGVAQDGRYGLPRDVEPEAILSYAYALLHSPGYRSRYAEFLKSDFPRVPLPGGRDVFDALATRGAELVSFHLTEAAALDDTPSRYRGPDKPQVGRVAWSDETVWLDARTKRDEDAGAQGTAAFDGVPQAVWEFRIGGYQVCHKWLKDRKGRALSNDDVAHYERIVASIAETIRLMQEVDDVIERHGGWPGAFAVGV